MGLPIGKVFLMSFRRKTFFIKKLLVSKHLMDKENSSYQDKVKNLELSRVVDFTQR